jgi:hypothetical protein
VPILGVLLFLLQFAFAIHAVKNNKDSFWVYAILFLPGIGCAVYFFTQVLPELRGSKASKRAQKTLYSAIDPNRELRERQRALEISDSLANRIYLADEYAESAKYSEAIEIYQSCLTKDHQYDPEIMLKLATALFANDQALEAKQTLDELIAHNPDFQSVDGHLLYARALETLGEHTAAIDEYKVLNQTYPGEEARIRYGLLLLALDQKKEAKAVFNQSLERERLGENFYRKRERQWFKIAREKLNELETS